MIIASIQARMGSTRVPGKVLKNISNKPLIRHVYDRVSQSEKIDHVVISTSTNPRDNELERYAQNEGLKYYRGSEDDLWQRHLETAESYNATVLIRVCGDCPLVEPEVINRALEIFLEHDADFVSNRNPKTYPLGLDIEIYNLSVLKKILQDHKGFYRRYPFQYILDHQDQFKVFNLELENNQNLTKYNFTVDYPQDFEFMEKIFEKNQGKPPLNFYNAIEILQQYPNFQNNIKPLLRGEEFQMAKKTSIKIEHNYIQNEKIELLNNETIGFDTRAILEWASIFFGDKILFASSFGAEDMVMIDLIAKLKLPLKIITLDTGRLPVETFDLIERTQQRYGVKIESYSPDTIQVEKMVNTKGFFSFRNSIENRKECCKIRKVHGLKRALKGKVAWITGLRRAQSVTRGDLPKIEKDAMFKIIKINPLYNWSEQDVWDYIKYNNVPYNKLHDQGYPSIGCQPCTRAIKDGEDVRAGRWWWENPEHKECGLHLHKPEK